MAGWAHDLTTGIGAYQIDLQGASFCEVPAPSFKESARGEVVRQVFQQLGLRNVRVDKAGNVIGGRPGAAARSASHVSIPSAIWLRAELCVQRNKTRSSLMDARA